MQMETNQAIVFAFYKDGKLKGFRQDTMGTIGMSAKIYHYSEEQVKIVLQNVFHNCEEVRKTFGEDLKDLAKVIEKDKLDNPGGHPIALMIGSISKYTSQAVADLGEFEVRVLPCPDYKDKTPQNKFGKYPTEEFLEWLKDIPEPIEVHKFKV